MSFLRLIRSKPARVESVSSGHEEDLFLKDSAGILGSNFPNPNRVGCPDALILEKIASRRLALREISPWLKHLSTCSDCFRDVRRFRDRTQRRRVFTWGVAGALAALIITVAVIAWSNGKLGTSHREQAILDLRNAAVSRGVGQDNHGSEVLPTLSRASKRVLVYLPADSAGDYELRIIDESGVVVADTRAVGKAENASTVLQIKIDLSRATPGLYSLLVKRGNTSTIYRIQLE